MTPLKQIQTQNNSETTKSLVSYLPHRNSSVPSLQSATMSQRQSLVMQGESLWQAPGFSQYPVSHRNVPSGQSQRETIISIIGFYDMIEIYCDTWSILQFQITYHCGKLVDYLLRVEQKARSHPHTFLGRCWDGIRLRFHKGKLLCHQVQSSGNCWSGQTPGIADVFPRCTLEIRFLHIYKCKGVNTIWDHDILSSKYKFLLPLAHSPHRSGQLLTTLGSVQLGSAFSQNSSRSQHVPVIISISNTKMTGNIIMGILRTLLDLYSFSKITFAYFAFFWAGRLDKIQGTIYRVGAPISCILTYIRLPFYPMDQCKLV